MSSSNQRTQRNNTMTNYATLTLETQMKLQEAKASLRSTFPKMVDASFEKQQLLMMWKGMYPSVSYIAVRLLEDGFEILSIIDGEDQVTLDADTVEEVVSLIHGLKAYTGAD